MGAAEWQRVKEVVAEALDRPPASRDAFLAEACGGDAALRAEVDDLLVFESDAADLIEVSAIAGLEGRDALVGTVAGAYRIEEQIGRGGMGTVYRAVRHDGAFRQAVALKLIAPGLASPDVLRRFRTERQILATLAHPYVARLLDGGALSDGRPFLVMEHIEGERIDAHCDARRMPIPDRLCLFLKVCEAVQYAHQRLVVHRDLKPNNILVLPDGTPKLLDFGIAKLLSPDLVDLDEPEATGSVLRLMTPEYASPEQFRGEPVTAATDVYALGVILYELLAGQRPYAVRRRDPQSLIEAVCKLEPRSPSTVVLDAADLAAGEKTALADRSAARGLTPTRLRQRLQGDLDRIVLMALRKEPERRYGSVEQLAADLRRHLEGLPVSARDGTLRYRAGKFVARHKTAVAAGLLTGLAIAGGVASTVRAARVAERERARAERRFQEQRKLANALLFEYHEAIAKLPGSTAVRQRLTTDAVLYLDALAREGGDLALQEELAAGYQKIGDVQSQLHMANVGNTAGALRSYEKALRLRQGIVDADPASVPARRALWLSCIRLAEALSKSGQVARAIELQRQALAIAQALWSQRPGDAQIAHDVSWSQVSLGRALLKVGDLGASLTALRAALATHLVYAGPAPSSVEARYERLVIQQATGYVRSLQGAPGEALPLYLGNLELTRQWVASDPTNAPARRAQMDAHEWVALALEDTGDRAGALSHHREALRLGQPPLDADPTNMQAHNDIADVHHRMAVVFARAGQHAEAHRAFERALEHYGKVAAADPADSNVRRQIALTLLMRAHARGAAGDRDAALADYRDALARSRALAAADASNAENRHDVALALSGIGQVLLARGEGEAAQAALDEARPVLEELLERSRENAQARADLAILLETLGAMHATRQEWAAAQARHAEALEHWRVLEGSRRLPLAHARRPAAVREAHARLSSALAGR